MENKAWDFMKYKNKVLFYQEKNGNSFVRNFKFEDVKPLFDEKLDYRTDGLFLVKVAGDKYVIFNAKFKTLSPKFDKFIFTRDYTNFVVENHSFGGKYKTIYNKYSNRFIDMKGSEIIPIANSDAFKIMKLRSAFGPTESRCKIFDAKNQIVLGEYGHVSNEALLGYVYVREGTGWSSPAYILNLADGKEIEDVYHNRLYQSLQVNQDEDSVNKMSSALSTFTYEHLFYCLPALKKQHEDLLVKEQQEQKRQKLESEKQIELSIKRHGQARKVVEAEEMTGSQPGEEE